MLSFFCMGVQTILRYVLPHRTMRDIYAIKDIYYLCSVIALAPVMLLAMQSVGRLNWYEVVLVLVFEIIAVFYLTRRRSKIS